MQRFAAARRAWLCLPYLLLVVPLALFHWQAVSQQRIEITGSKLPNNQKNSEYWGGNGGGRGGNGGGRYFTQPETGGGGGQGYSSTNAKAAVPATTPEPDKPPAEGDSEVEPACGEGGPSTTPTSSNPVIIATGEKILPETDAGSAGLYGMSLDRAYRSINTTGYLFGLNWASSLDPVRVTKSTLPCVNSRPCETLRTRMNAGVSG